MKLEELEQLTIVQAINYKSFKEKIKITKKYGGKGKIEIFDNYVMVESKRYVR